jgi:hypothetical protein
MFQPTNIQNIALNSTIVTFDILKKSPLYNEMVFRSFADRTIGLSPTDFGPGAANVGDRFSERYTGMLERIVATLDRKVSAADADFIKNAENEIKLLEQKLEQAYHDMAKRWSDHKRDEGITDQDPMYLEKMIAFYNSFSFATKIGNIHDDIDSQYEDITATRVRAYPDAQSREIATLFRYAMAKENQVARPKNPSLEVDRGYDDIKLAQLWIISFDRGAFDVGQEIQPSGYLGNFLDVKGTRGYSVTKGASAQHSHDAEWHTHASGGWLFFEASVDASHESHWRSSVSKINKVGLSFENMAEYWVNRGRWYSSTIFDHQLVKDYLKSNPKLARDLSYVITSVVIGRGLTVTLTFDSTEEFEEWSSLDVSAGGSGLFDIMGILAPLGANAGYKQHDWGKSVDTQNKTVTFADGSDNCRLLGFRVEKLYQFNEAERAKEFLYWEDYAAAELANLTAGKMSFRDFALTAAIKSFIT